MLCPPDTGKVPTIPAPGRRRSGRLLPERQRAPLVIVAIAMDTLARLAGQNRSCSFALIFAPVLRKFLHVHGGGGSFSEATYDLMFARNALGDSLRQHAPQRGNQWDTPPPSAWAPGGCVRETRTTCGRVRRRRINTAILRTLLLKVTGWRCEKAGATLSVAQVLWARFPITSGRPVPLRLIARCADASPSRDAAGSARLEMTCPILQWSLELATPTAEGLSVTIACHIFATRSVGNHAVGTLGARISPIGWKVSP